MLVKMEPMMEFCPAWVEKTLPFHYFFNQRFPKALWTQLGEVENGDPRALLARADRLCTINVPPVDLLVPYQAGHPGNSCSQGFELGPWVPVV